MIIDVDRHQPFQLDEDFLEPYREQPVDWGFGALSWVTYKRTYSRNGEKWWQTCQRVVEGMITVQRIHCQENGLPWDNAKAQRTAREAYDRLFHFKWTPPGRGLWIMGTRFMYERGGAALNNCGFVSTADLSRDFTRPFLWMLRMSMLGVGVGFDTRGKGTMQIQQPQVAKEEHCVGDSREGWAQALKRLLDAYTGKGTLPAAWNYRQIRPKGVPLKSFGGTASGAGPLRKMLNGLQELYDSYGSRKVDSRLIVDTMNIIGRCVVAGGIRRSAQIALGEPDDMAFLDLKADREKVEDYRWVSNNSILASAGMDYSEAVKRSIVNGEPGYFWLDNARAYGRMCDPPDWSDAEAMGSNPCVEQTLWNNELCCLVETYPARHRDLEDYLRTVRIAFQYAKTVTLVPTEDADTNRIMLKNRRIGCSMTGIVQAINRFGPAFFEWCDTAYAQIQQLDKEYSHWLDIPRSIKTTSVKPSGTVSLLAGATPGVHWEHAPYYIRRIRVSERRPLVDICRRAGYHVEPDHYSDDTMVISFPVEVPHLDRRKADVPLEEKVRLAVKMQNVWSDNQVSCTAEFDPETEAEQVPLMLRKYDRSLKSLVFLPSRGHGYQQPPYEEITAERYRELAAGLKPLDGEIEHEHELEAKFCEGGICEVT